MTRLQTTNKNQKPVKCPDCNHIFYTSKKGEIQCKNGHYFDTGKNQIKI